MSSDKDISVPDLISYYWRKKLVIIVTTLCFIVISVTYALVASEVYESKVLIAPADTQENQLSGLANSQLGGLASLAGLNLGATSSVSKIDLAFAILTSKNFLSKFIVEYNLKHDIMAAESWDNHTKSMVYDESYNVETHTWKDDGDVSSEPSLQKTTTALLEMITIEPAESNGFFYISLESPSPEYAEVWLEKLILELNEAVRRNEQLEAQHGIAFLESKLGEVSSSEIKSVIYELIEEQTKRLMFTEVRPEYAVKVIDPAYYPEQRSHPKRALIVIIGTLMGGLFAFLFVTVRYFYSRVNE